MEAYFIVAQIEGGIKKFKLCDGEFVIIGRSSNSAQVKVDDPSCSGKHCKISMINNSVLVEDLDSKNGVFLNGVRVLKQNFYLKDKLKVGNNIIYIHEGKLTDEDRDLLTYKNESGTQIRDLTFEMDTPVINPREMGRKRRLKVEINEGPEARGRIVPAKHLEKKKPSFATKTFLDVIAYLIDLSLAAIVFIIAVFACALTKGLEYSNNSNVVSMMLTEEMSIYTISVTITVLLFFIYNRRRATGSLGERLMGIN